MIFQADDDDGDGDDAAHDHKMLGWFYLARILLSRCIYSQPPYGFYRCQQVCHTHHLLQLQLLVHIKLLYFCPRI